MNKIVVIANARFEKGLIAFINSYIKTNMESQLVIIDTGLQNRYPYDTIKKEFNVKGLKKAEWMSDYSPYLQLELGDIDADKIIYLEADMLLLNNIDYLFKKIAGDNFIAVMDDAAYTICNSWNKINIDSAGRYFISGSELSNKYKYYKGYNGGLIGASIESYRGLQSIYNYYLQDEKQYRLLAQSLLNQYFIEEGIVVNDVGLENNLSGINEYYDYPQLYDIIFYNNKYRVKFNGFDINVLHFTGKNKPFFNNDINIMRSVWDYYYNNGRLFNV